MLEVQSAGGYSLSQWFRNTIGDGLAGFMPSPESFSHFGDIYVVENTMTEDLGRYEISLSAIPFSGHTEPAAVIYDVISQGKVTVYLIVIKSKPSF